MTRAKREVLVKQSTDAERWTVNLEEPGSPLHGIPVYRPLRKISTCLPSRPLLTPSPPIFIDWLYSNLMLKILISCAGSIYAARLACTCSLYILRELFRLPQIWLSIIIIECNNQNHYKGKPTGWEAGKMKRRVIHWKGIIMIRTPDTSFLPKLFACPSGEVNWERWRLAEPSLKILDDSEERRESIYMLADQPDRLRLGVNCQAIIGIIMVPLEQLK